MTKQVSPPLPPCLLSCSLSSLVTVRTAVCIVTVQQKDLVWLCPVSDISESWENSATSGKLNPAALIIYVAALKSAHKLVSHWAISHELDSLAHTCTRRTCLGALIAYWRISRGNVRMCDTWCSVSRGSRAVPGCARLCRAVPGCPFEPEPDSGLFVPGLVYSTGNHRDVWTGGGTPSMNALLFPGMKRTASVHTVHVCWCWLLTPTVYRLFIIIFFFFCIKMCELFFIT